MFSKRLLSKREQKNQHMDDYLTEDNKYLFNMLKKQTANNRKKYNLRNKEFNLAKKLEMHSVLENDEILKSSNSFYKFAVSFLKQDAKRSQLLIKSSKLKNPRESSQIDSTLNSATFSWQEFLKLQKSKYEPQPTANNLKRKYETIQSTTISSDEDEIIEITPKKVDRKRVLTPFVSSQNQNDPKQQYLETLKKLNLDIIQENNKILFPTMNCNPLFSLPTLPFPIQANNPLQNLQNTNLLNNLRLAMNSNIFSNLNISGFLPSMLNYPMNFLPSNWSNLPGLNQIAQSKVNKINFLNNQPQTSNLNSILQLLQQNGQNPSNL